MASNTGCSKSNKALVLLIAGFSACAVSASDLGEQLKARNEKIRADYAVAIEQCSALKGHSADVCKEEAKGVRAKAEARLESDRKPSADASRRMQERIAEADFRVANVKCAALKGNEKDVCRKEAKAARVSAIETAKTNKEVLERKEELAIAKNDAAYELEKERCDAYKSAQKDKCLAEAKLNYGK